MKNKWGQEMKIKMICSDLDGTLLNSEGSISKENIQAMRYVAENDIKIVLASGRSYESIRFFSEEILQIPTYKVCFNGAQLFAPHGLLLRESVIDFEVVLRVLRIAKENRIAVNFSTTSKWINYYPNSSNSKMDKYNETSKDISIGSEHQLRDLCNERIINILKIGMHIVNKSKRNKVYKKLKDLPINAVQSDTEFIEATGMNISKYTALEYLCTINKISVSNVMAFGDYENDYEMIKKVGYGVAMGNGLGKVKEVAKFVTNTNNENGVARVLYPVIMGH